MLDRGQILWYDIRKINMLPWWNTDTRRSKSGFTHPPSEITTIRERIMLGKKSDALVVL